jgi:tRNA 2-thiouridine synthesizing protein A
MTETRLDLRGLKCPLPALRTAKALRAAAPGTLLVIACTDPMAAIDLPNLVRETGDVIEGQSKAEGELEFRIRKRRA